jgi:hypothetical protein
MVMLECLFHEAGREGESREAVCCEHQRHSPLIRQYQGRNRGGVVVPGCYYLWLLFLTVMFFESALVRVDWKQFSNASSMRLPEVPGTHCMCMNDGFLQGH